MTSLAQRLACGLGPVLLAVGAAAPAAAQAVPAGGLFRIEPGGTVRASAVGARLSVYQAYDQNLFGAPRVPGDGSNPLFTLEGPYAGLDASAGYQRRTRRTRLSLLGTGEVRYFPGLSSALADSYGGGAEWMARLSGRTSFTLGALAARRSSFQLGSLADLRREASADLSDPGLPAPALVGVSSSVQAGRTSLRHRLSPRTNVAADYAFARIRYDSVDVKLQTHTGGARLTRRLPGGFDMRLGYRVALWDVRPLHRLTSMHSVDAGLGYATDLGTRTSFNASSGVVVVPQSERSMPLRLALSAGLDHRFSQHWSGGVQYGRGMHFLEGVADPLSYDRVQGYLSGRMTRRATASLSAGYATGRVVILPGGRSYDLAEAGAALEYEAFRRLGLFARYRLTRYDFAADALLALGVPGALNRHAVLVGLTAAVWTPLN